MRLEVAYGASADEMAAELAEHFVRGQDTHRAIRYLQQAADNAARRYAPHEVIGPLQRALTLLATLPEIPAQVQQKLDLQVALGAAFIATKGNAAPEVEQTYARARMLCQRLGETPQLFPVLFGLWTFYLNHPRDARPHGISPPNSCGWPTVRMTPRCSGKPTSRPG
jgi:predicted ATPase